MRIFRRKPGVTPSVAVAGFQRSCGKRETERIRREGA